VQVLAEDPSDEGSDELPDDLIHTETVAGLSLQERDDLVNLPDVITHASGHGGCSARDRVREWRQLQTVTLGSYDGGFAHSSVLSLDHRQVVVA
jgi:hypothetical protein